MPKNQPPLNQSHGLSRRAYLRNPIVVIALFVLFIEVIATVSLKFLLDAGSHLTTLVVSFITIFPLLFLLLFFGTLWFKRESLYNPSSGGDDT